MSRRLLNGFIGVWLGISLLACSTTPSQPFRKGLSRSVSLTYIAPDSTALMTAPPVLLRAGESTDLMIAVSTDDGAVVKPATITARFSSDCPMVMVGPAGDGSVALSANADGTCTLLLTFDAFTDYSVQVQVGGVAPNSAQASF